MRFSFINLIITSILLLSASSSNTTIRKQQKDLAVFLETIRAKEGILDIHTPIDSMEFYFERLEENLQEEKSSIEQFKLFSATTAKIQCGHTQLQVSKKPLKEWVQEKNALPIDYYLIGQKLFSKKIVDEDKKIVNHGKTPRQQKANIPPDCEIFSIDGKTVPQMMEGISNYVSSDENGIEFKYYYVAQLFEFYRYLAFPEHKDSTQIVYISKKDTSQIYLYNGYPPVKSINKRIEDYTEKTNKNSKDIGKFSIVKGKYGLFKFISFAECKGRKYEEFLEKSFESLHKKKIKYLIVDLRGNTGGQMQFSLMRYFVGANIKVGRYVVSKPKKMFENRHIKKHNKFYMNHRLLTHLFKYRKRKNPAFDGSIYTDKVDDKLIYKGKIIVITDEATFSAASILACNLKMQVNAQIAGHTAGGSFYTGNAGTLKVLLPNSKFVLFVNPNTFKSTLAENSDSQSIKIPDFIVDPIYPYMKKKDEWYINKVTKYFKK